MPSKIILIVMAMVIVCMMLFGNKKVRILSVLIKQLQVFKNAKTDKISVWDIVVLYFSRLFYQSLLRLDSEV